MPHIGVHSADFGYCAPRSISKNQQLMRVCVRAGVGRSAGERAAPLTSRGAPHSLAHPPARALVSAHASDAIAHLDLLRGAKPRRTVATASRNRATAPRMLLPALSVAATRALVPSPPANARALTTAAVPGPDRGAPESLGVQSAMHDEAPHDDNQLPLGSIIKVRCVAPSCRVAL